MHKLLSLALLVLAAPASAQEVRPLATLDSASILIGQQAHVDLRVSYRVDQGATPAIEWPAIADTLTAHIAVVHDSHVDTVAPQKDKDPYLLEQTRTLTITSWDSGYWAIPPFVFVIDGDTVGTNALLLTVNTVDVDTTKAFRDIKEIYEVPFRWTDWLREHWPWIAGGAAALAVLAGTIVLLVRRARRPKPKRTVQEPEKPLHVRTLLALEDLDRKKLWQQGLTKQYHTDLTDILRGYVEERFGVQAMELTTDELMGALKLSAMGAAQREQLGNLLRLADMVKFAKWAPLPAENEQMMAGAIKLVTDTTEQRPDAPHA
ncbi:MAG: hypothetical protein JST66_16495 [Bacteroidetes bacterium]|nr:hypothetical protein [Bacteroidota bacterium]